MCRAQATLTSWPALSHLTIMLRSCEASKRLRLRNVGNPAFYSFATADDGVAIISPSEQRPSGKLPNPLTPEYS